MCGDPTLRSSGKGLPAVGVDPPKKSGSKEVRGCRSDDLPTIMEILQNSPQAASWSREALEETLEREPGHFLVGLYDQQIAGFIIGRRIREEGEILNLAVHPKARRRGVANALTKAMLDAFVCAGVSSVHLEVRESNSSAIDLYQRVGFRLASRREGYYHAPEEAALLLRLEL
jgi:[ribosomal protein S18]-alanine N-acetyltransferase